MGLFEDLDGLTNLRDRGALSAEEFEAAKRRMLESAPDVGSVSDWPDLVVPVDEDERARQLYSQLGAVGKEQRLRGLLTSAVSEAVTTLRATETVFAVLAVTRRLDHRLLVATNQRLLMTSPFAMAGADEFAWPEVTGVQVGTTPLRNLSLTVGAKRFKLQIYGGDVERFADVARYLAPRLPNPDGPPPRPVPLVPSEAESVAERRRVDGQPLSASRPMAPEGGTQSRPAWAEEAPGMSPGTGLAALAVVVVAGWILWAAFFAPPTRIEECVGEALQRWPRGSVTYQRFVDMCVEMGG